MEQRTKGRLMLAGGTLLFIALVVVAIIFYVIDSRKTSILRTIIAPSFATLTVNNKTYPINKDIRFEPGEYSITISADGFQSAQENIVLKDQETTTFAIYLERTDGDTFSWYEGHNEEYSTFMSAANYLADQSAANFAAKYPVSSILPFNIVEVDPVTYDWTEYKVGGGKTDDCKTEFCIIITDTTGGNREKALDKIREKGYNPDDYQIIYKYTPIEPLPTN